MQQSISIAVRTRLLLLHYYVFKECNQIEIRHSRGLQRSPALICPFLLPIYRYVLETIKKEHMAISYWGGAHCIQRNQYFEQGQNDGACLHFPSCITYSPLKLSRDISVAICVIKTILNICTGGLQNSPTGHCIFF
jgi:hypothetical protein